MRKLSLALLLVAACGGDDDSDACVFDGRYSMGFVPITEGCQPQSLEIPFYGLKEEECLFSTSDVAPNGVSFDVSMSCRPGDPVGECEGFTTYSNGCSYNVYLRRLAAE